MAKKRTDPPVEIDHLTPQFPDGDRPKLVQLNAYLEPELVAAAKVAAANKGLSLSSLVRQLLLKETSDRPTVALETIAPSVELQIQMLQHENKLLQQQLDSYKVFLERIAQLPNPKKH